MNCIAVELSGKVLGRCCLRKFLPRLFMLVLCFGVLAQPGMAWAEKYALLVGVGEYNHSSINNLDGPKYDVEVLSQTLQQYFGYSKEKILPLVDKAATRQAILAALNRLAETTRPGDSLLFYYSGHGTSSFDDEGNHNNFLGLPPDTGVILPVDFRPGSVKNILDSLIIGSRDLRPIIQRIDADRDVVEIFDSCFSGKTHRSIMKKGYGTPRYANLNELTGDAAPAGHGSGMVQAAKSQGDGYPYRRLIALSAATEREKALDITWADIRSGAKTFDGKPHGAFTDALLRGMQGAADNVRDNRLSLTELFQYVEQQVSTVSRQRPQMHKPPALSGHEPLFAMQGTGHKPQATWMSEETKPLSLDARLIPVETQTALQSITGVQLVPDSADMTISKEDAQFALYLNNGSLLCRLDSEQELLTRISRQLALKKLAAIGIRPKSYNLLLQIAGDTGGLVEGESVGVDLTAEQAGYLLLININTAGAVNILYPVDPNELPARKTIAMPDLGVVSAPHFGTEMMVAIAFRTEPPFWRDLPAMRSRGELDDIPPTAPLLENILKAVDSKAFAAGTSVSIRTVAKGDIMN